MNGSDAGGGDSDAGAVDWDQPMTANDDTPSTGKDPAESIDSELQIDDGVSRRRFLGAAAVLAGLTGFTGSGTATNDQPDVTVERDDTGTTQGSLPKRDPNGAFLELYNPHDKDATVQAKAWHFPDHEEESHVSLGVAMDACHFSVNVTPEEARTIAQDLEAAADVAEGKHDD